MLIPEPIISFKRRNTLSRRNGPQIEVHSPGGRPLRYSFRSVGSCAGQTDGGSNDGRRCSVYGQPFRGIARSRRWTREPTRLFDLKKSLGAYFAKKRATEANFEAKVLRLRTAITTAMPGSLDNATAVLATQSGLSAQLLTDLRDRIRDEVGELPTTIDGWLAWTIAWLDKNSSARDDLLGDTSKSIIAIVGKKAKEQLAEGDIAKLLPEIRLG